MQTATDNLMQIAEELNAAGKQVKVTVLKPRKARRSELIMSSTKGVRTNTNRRGQSYTGHATYATQSTVEGNRSAYFNFFVTTNHKLQFFDVFRKRSSP